MTSSGISSLKKCRGRCTVTVRFSSSARSVFTPGPWCTRVTSPAVTGFVAAYTTFAMTSSTSTSRTTDVCSVDHTFSYRPRIALVARATSGGRY